MTLLLLSALATVALILGFKLDDALLRMKQESSALFNITMAHNLNLRIIAEGVETRAQQAFLKRKHCDDRQGYYLSRPLAA